MVTSIAIGDEVVTTKEEYSVSAGTKATVREICWIDLETTHDVKFCVGLVFPDNICYEYEVRNDDTWGYYNTEIEKIEEK